MKKYKYTHLWMVIPFIIVIISFIRVYFSTWSSEPWAYHIHGISAMGWFALLVIQPYFASRNKLISHRFWGMIGLILAGGVTFSAMAILPTDVQFAINGGFPPVVYKEFFYGIAFTELIAVLGFLFAVVMSVVQRKKIHDHAAWLISSVFLVLMPGLGRGLGQISHYQLGSSYAYGLQASIVIIMIALVIVGIKIKKLTHPSFIIAFLVNLLFLFTWKIGSNPEYQDFIIRLMKPLPA